MGDGEKDIDIIESEKEHHKAWRAKISKNNQVAAREHRMGIAA